MFDMSIHDVFTSIEPLGKTDSVLQPFPEEPLTLQDLIELGLVESNRPAWAAGAGARG
jgi:hypothetical protein